MVKTDEHMGKIKKKLYDEAAGKKASADAKKQRDLKKFGKQVQVAKLQQRAKDKKESIEKINDLKKSMSLPCLLTFTNADNPQSGRQLLEEVVMMTSSTSLSRRPCRKTHESAGAARPAARRSSVKRRTRSMDLVVKSDTSRAVMRCQAVTCVVSLLKR